MTGYEVNTAYLRGYAGQLRGNADGATTISDYAATHLRNFDRISGLLEPAQWYSSFFADLFVDKVCPAVHGLLRRTSDQLTQSAITYDTAEQDALVRFQAGQGGGTGTAPPDTAPPDTQAPPGVQGFTDGADVAPKPPKDERLTGWVEDKLADLLGEVTAVVRFFTGYDIIDEWAPVVLGDWGAIYRLADAYNEVTHSFRAVHQDVKAGMDVLAPHWLGSDGGAAAAGFGKHVGGRILPGLDLFAETADSARAAHEYIAITYEAIVTNAIWLLDYYAVRFKSVVKRIATAVKELSLDMSTWLNLGEELFSIAEDYIEFVKTTFQAIEVCLDQYRELGEMAFETIDLALTFVEFKAAGN
jgi:hypothetical protein